MIDREASHGSGVTPGEALRLMRMRAGHGQAQFAKLAKVSVETVIWIEAGDIEMGPRRAVRFAKLLHCSPELFAPSRGAPR